MTVAPPPTPASSRFVIHDVSWAGYEALLREIGDRRVYLTYDRGTLEMMSPSPLHGRVCTLISRLIWAYTEELRIPIASYGMSTFRREDVARGLEPDNCFYILNEARVRGRDDLDLASDPPPDLAIEIDVSRSALDRQGIYESLGIRELWIWENERLEILVLGPDRAYVPSALSLNLPGLPPDVVTRFLGMRGLDENSWILSFRDWVRQEATGSSRP